MKTSQFLTTLRQHSGLPLIFRVQGDIVSPGYHLTEVKRVNYETMDCGAETHSWAETQFELWVPPMASVLPGRGHMPADKFMRIIEKVETKLPLNGEAVARIHASIEGQPAALHDIEGTRVHDGALWVDLTPDRTRCKAAERRSALLTGGLCCGDGAKSETPEPAAEAGCGCGGKGQPEKSACCA
jgi:hypothetical protein